jgi:hypothetical protein
MIYFFNLLQNLVFRLTVICKAAALFVILKKVIKILFGIPKFVFLGNTNDVIGYMQNCITSALNHTLLRTYDSVSFFPAAAVVVVVAVHQHTNSLQKFFAQLLSVMQKL